jgi:hypothetical protein
MVWFAVAVVRSEGTSTRFCTLGAAHRMGASTTPTNTSKSWVARARSSMCQQAAVLPLRRHA